ncbi:bifunctional metallophosphatase/5'-nucleotidase [Algoriphagus sediminis]|uniref:Metallophosphatase n=1 Tax=Algoriphagus sediminis TaxID=3057113 RepID=A0ABT7YD17_9BACT|nr:metallophosphatase [Algoriphagus sediminis]MDN3204414.1 metallophosphatase [Algoriphagus sediminis]
MKRRQFLLRSLSATASMAFSPFIFSSCRPSLHGKKLTILHTNDMHSYIEPFEEGRYQGLGGMAARASIVNKIRFQEANVMLLDSGDVFQGTPYFNLFGGELELKLMSEMGYDATTVGNHEFDNGIGGLEHAMQFANFPHLIANYDFSRNTLSGKVKPFKIFERGEIKIGVFGLGIELEGLVNSRMYDGTLYIDPIATAKEMVQELQKQGCDLIVCLSHLGYDYGDSRKPSDLILAKEVSEIDVILGGHTHTFMEEPLLLTNSEGFTTTINQVGWAGINLGRIDVMFTEKGKKVVAFNPMPLLNKV